MTTKMAWWRTIDATIDRSNNATVDHDDEADDNKMRRRGRRTTIRPRRRRRCHPAAGEDGATTTTTTTTWTTRLASRPPLSMLRIGDDDGEGRPTMMKYSTMTTTTYWRRSVGSLLYCCTGLIAYRLVIVLACVIHTPQIFHFPPRTPLLSVSFDFHFSTRLIKVGSTISVYHHNNIIRY